MKPTLRDYQEEAINKMMWAMGMEGNDLLSMAQGSGKSLVIAEFAHRLGQPVLILCLNKELLMQDIDKMAHYIPREDIGVFSASLNSRTVKDITFATIQSIYRNPKLFQQFNVAIVDEADLLSPKKLDTMYRKFISGAGIKKVFGLTGTPFRLGTTYKRWGYAKWQVTSQTVTQMINRHYPAFWSRMLYVKNVNELQEEGYLVPLTYFDRSIVDHSELKTNKTKSEFDLEDFDARVSNHYTPLAKWITSISRNKKLIFCSTVAQANTLQALIPDSMVVTATTDKKTRENAVQHFREGKKGTLLGVGIFTTGFDVPDLDCIISLRPTRSLRLWSQVIGRGTRTSEGKTTCYVYDLAWNIKSLGTLESMVIGKIDGKWNVVTDAEPEGFHNKVLFEFKLKAPTRREDLQVSI